MPLAEHRDKFSGQVVRTDKVAAQGIVEIMIDVSDQVGQAHHFPLTGGWSQSGIRINQRPLPLGMTNNAVSDLTRQIQPPSIPLQQVDDTQALPDVTKTARYQPVQHPFTGMAEGRMPKIMAKSDRLCEILIEAKGPGDGTRYLGHFECVRQSGPVVISFRGKKYLGLVFEPSERFAMKNAITINLKTGTNTTFFFGPYTTF
ncbi:MAG: hypothetical protein Tsb0017_02690 [Geothermobacteraceae bacterium]